MRTSRIGDMRVLITGGSGFIGSHLVSRLVEQRCEVLNVDTAKPLSKQPGTWEQCSILDTTRLASIFDRFQPKWVVHLAALASMEARSIKELRVNTEGTTSVLDACKKSNSVERVIVTSTQHVRKPGAGPASSDTDFAPYMAYGESKVLTEQLTRSANLESTWTIIRPTAIWGPRHLLLAEGLWKLLKQRRYFHPQRDAVVRSYGYVKNAAWQIEKLLKADSKSIDRKVFYVGDGNFRQQEWVNAFSRSLTGQDVRTLPTACIGVLAKVGDAMRYCGLKFPIYTSRFRNMVTSNPVSIQPTLDLLGAAPYSLEEGVEETVDWLNWFYETRN
jgi:nucleoside-diphosphate-sugar epimerase